ncbi:transcription factor Adf-1-like [Sabethes cyaneus]|uniref:transcription factor Adf-1-like n=1 Tax=Sabethes cyaneus TaxID=53552 RepID=UPI00237E29FA|nr:transcription factor Adf-1-like [Sabethes cyaneus]
MESLSAETRGEIYEKLWIRMPKLNANPVSNFRIDEFIGLIKRYPIIYNRLDKHNKQEYGDTWEQLEAILNTPKKFLMMKWKGLRDNFRVELKKEYYSTPENRYISKWVHYKKLSFLKDQVLATLDQKYDSDSQDQELNQIMQFVQSASQEEIPGPLSVTRANEHSYAHNDSEQLKIKQERDEMEDGAQDTADEADSFSFNHFQDPANFCTTPKTTPLPEITITPKIVSSPEITITPKMIPSPTFQHQPINLQRKRRSEGSQESLAIQSKVARNHSDTVPQDDDYHFLMSIHPYLKQLPLPVKLKVRLQMQQVLFNELMKQPIADEED